MRLKDLKIGHANSGGIYTKIYSIDDFDKFFSLCLKHHAECYKFTADVSYKPTVENIKSHLKSCCVAYVASVNGVVGVNTLREMQKLSDYEELTTTKHQLHEMTKFYKE